MIRIVAHGSLALHNHCLPTTLQSDTVAIVEDDTRGKKRRSLPQKKFCWNACGVPSVIGYDLLA